MGINRKLSFKKGLSLLETIITVLVLCIIIILAWNFMKNNNKEAAVGRDVIRCIIDENASNLNSPACKRVISHCSNNNIKSCEKLIFYTDDGVHSDEALTVLSSICAKGGEAACDAIINRCIEDSSNCEIHGKPYDIKDYLAMNGNIKNAGEAMMLKKLKTYYDKDVDNIVTNVIDTCITDKDSMACKIFTSKVYKFTPSEKSYFVLSSNSTDELEFSKTGINLFKKTELAMESKKNTEKTTSEVYSSKNETLTDKVNNNVLQNTQETEKEINNDQENDDLNKDTVELSNEQASPETVKDNQEKSTNLTKKQINEIPEQIIYKASLTTGEDNNIDYIKNKIYSFDITYKEPLNTKIRWLVSFDDRSTWKKWDGTNWVQVNEPSSIENIDFSKEGNTCSEIEKGLTNYTLQPGEISLDFAVELMSTDKEVTPVVNKVEIKHY